MENHHFSWESPLIISTGPWAPVAVEPQPWHVDPRGPGSSPWKQFGPHRFTSLPALGNVGANLSESPP